MRNIDFAKVFIVGMAVVIVGLGIAILLFHNEAKGYEAAFDETVPELYTKLADEVESCKVFQDREEEGQKVNMDNPITYLQTMASQSQIDSSAFRFQPGRLSSNPQKGYKERFFKVTFLKEIERKTLADFLYRLENGSTLITVTSLTLKRSKEARRDAEADVWEPIVEIGYRVSHKKD